MADRHLVRYQQLIQEQLSSLILRELDLEPGILVTISKVIVSADLQVADVKITVFPTDKQGTVLQKLRKNHKEYEYYLADILSRGRSPELRFEIDTEALEAYEVEKLLDELSE
ncbi:MAG: Ribosome-binding factor [Candidatus Parcubacteria bacterium]|jgi:ribosome-binding factor A